LRGEGGAGNLGAPILRRREMDWMQILLVIILLGICVELGYVVKAIGSTNRLLANLLKHIKPG
jgi:hypothetical protein